LESEPHITEGTPELAEDASGEAATVKESGAASSPATSSEAVDENKNSAGAVWNISFEQFLASILTESVLVDHFSKGVDIQVECSSRVDIQVECSSGVNIQVECSSGVDIQVVCSSGVDI